jgi:quinol monooxygenase YgiN
MSKIILQGHIIVPDADLDKVSSELVNHSRLTNAETGCLVFEVNLDEVIANKFNVYEEFVDQRAFDNHQIRVKESYWGKITLNVLRHYQITHCE